MKQPFSKLQSLLKLKSEDGNKPTKMAYVLLIALFGLLLLIVSDLFATPKPSPSLIQDETNQANSETTSQEQETFLQKEQKQSNALTEKESYYEQQLQELLNAVQGVSEVEVMVNLDSTEVKVYEKNESNGRQTTEETDRNGGERTVEDVTEESQVVLTRKGDQEIPVLVKTEKAPVRGVLVVAKGADHMKVQQSIKEAVSRSMDVPTHRISVMPKK
ncbi:stage III sporulation protein AG [Pontibacillus litoralis]|uniref:Stage III sporulation protein AG n=1 Tax=Pontibacillus litoralis JSM 072002 TaxID=1385512 RepID=A0A0A5GCC0_9BACI|nr:stage III sporulation protein AG [Pontibacillus litoralis]KGX88843.1 stage III sporulation protein AG [Pontibacillus litoralis JSM 072002]